MAETAFLGAIIIAQFTVLAGMMLYIAQRLERRMDRLETRMDRIEERLRAVEFHVARLVGRVFGGESGEFAFASVDPDGGPTDAPEPVN